MCNNTFMEIKDALKKYMDKSPAAAGDKTINDLLIYTNELIEKNKQFNLTAITDPEEIAVKHILDSMYLLAAMGKDKPASLADAGAGLPGIVAAIADENIITALIESNGKKANFLKTVIDKIQIKNASVIQQRSEDASWERHLRQKFESVTMRAFAEFKTAMELTSGLCAVKGKIYYFASSDQLKEIRREGKIYGELKIKFEDVYDYTLPLNIGKRHIVIIRKTGDTPDNFPRAYQRIKAKPLTF